MLFSRSAAVALAVTVALTSGLFAHLEAGWWLENLVIASLFVFLPRLLPRLSPVSLWMLLVLLCLHEYGAVYSYATPLGEWMRPWFGSSRNHYDRLVHFCFGLLTYRPLREMHGSRRGAVESVLSISALYEMLEWLVAEIADPALGAEFVGAQGDAFDAPKDMALALLGALLATCCDAGVSAVRQR